MKIIKIDRDGINLGRYVGQVDKDDYKNWYILVNKTSYKMDLGKFSENFNIVLGEEEYFREVKSKLVMVRLASSEGIVFLKD